MPVSYTHLRGRKEIMSTMQRLNKERHITVVYITHYMSEAMAADRVIVNSFAAEIKIIIETNENKND